MTIKAERAGKSETAGRSGPGVWRIVGWSLAGLLLLLPLIAMQFTGEVGWTASDFVIAGILIGGVGLLYEVTVRRTRNWAQRAGIGIALLASFLTIWVNGAVGMIGSEDSSFNLLFLGVILLALVGAIAAGFGAAGMARAMAAAAIAQAIVSAIGMSQDLRGGILSMCFAGIWLLAAAFFWKAARDKSA